MVMEDHTELDDAQTPLSIVADYAMELVDRITADNPEGFELGEVIVIAEVECADGSPTYLEAISTEKRPYVNKAILKRAIKYLLEEVEELELIEDDEDYPAS